MTSQYSSPDRSEAEFTGDSGLIRRFSEDGMIVYAIINDRPIELMTEKFVDTTDGIFSIKTLFDRFKEIQDVDPTSAPLTAIQTIDALSPEDYRRNTCDKEWYLQLLGRSLLDMHDRDEAKE